jgi:putative Mg2+ transporter-C (MgtC) family protein
MISLAACSFTILALALVGQVGAAGVEGGRADPIRALEAVATGVAFLGAGAIIQSRGDVQGITTGSGIWLAGAIGLACGGGYYFLAFVATVFGIILLAVFGLFEKHVIDEQLGRNGKKARAPKSR